MNPADDGLPPPNAAGAQQKPLFFAEHKALGLVMPVSERQLGMRSWRRGNYFPDTMAERLRGYAALRNLGDLFSACLAYAR